MIRTCVLCEATSAGTAVRFANQSALCNWCRDELRRTARGFCPRCQRVYPLAEMRDRYCKADKRAINQAYRAGRIEQEKARVAAWKKAHPHTKTPEQRRRWYVAHADTERARSRAWHAANRSATLERQKAYKAARVAANPDYWRDQRQRAKVRLFKKLFS